MSDALRWQIINLVRAHNGIKSTDLMGGLMVEFLSVTKAEVSELLLDMISEGEIKEVEYVIDHVSRSLFLPANTEVRYGK